MDGAAAQNENAKLAGRFLIAVVGLMMLYVLSIGPVALVLGRTHSTPSDPGTRIANLVYAPLIWADRSTGFHHPLRAYVRFWTAL